MRKESRGDGEEREREEEEALTSSEAAGGGAKHLFAHAKDALGIGALHSAHKGSASLNAERNDIKCNKKNPKKTVWIRLLLLGPPSFSFYCILSALK